MKKSIISFFAIACFLLANDLTRDANGIVTDSTTNLMWQDNSNQEEKTWSDAINYCENLVLGGYSDWRLPNINELFSLVDYSKSQDAIRGNTFVFFNTSMSNWTSTSKKNNFLNAWNIDFEWGDSTTTPKTSTKLVKCVRAGQ